MYLAEGLVLIRDQNTDCGHKVADVSILPSLPLLLLHTANNTVLQRYKMSSCDWSIDWAILNIIMCTKTQLYTESL